VELFKAVPVEKREHVFNSMKKLSKELNLMEEKMVDSSEKTDIWRSATINAKGKISKIAHPTKKIR
jgi:hypothetical protein